MPGMRTSIRITSGRSSPGQRHALRAVARLAHDLEVRLRLEHHPEAHAQELLVVDEQDAGAHAGVPTSGTTSSTRQPPSSRGPGLQPALVDRGALAHASQAGARPVRRGRRRAVGGVDHFELERLGTVLDAQPRARSRPRVLERVGQRLLDDAEDRQLQPRGERDLRPPGHLVADRQTRGAHVLQQLVELVEPGLRRQPRVLVVLAQDAEQAAHLGQRLAAGARRGAHRVLGALRVVLDRIAGTVGQRDHHRHVVGDDVVHLARDPCPLRGGGQPALLVALALEPIGALLQRGHERAAIAGARAHHRGGRRQTGEPDERIEPVAVAPADQRQHDAELEHRHRRHRQPSRTRDGHAVEGDEQRHIPERAHVEQPLDEGDQRDRREHLHRPAAPHSSGRIERDRERRGSPSSSAGRPSEAKSPTIRSPATSPASPSIGRRRCSASRRCRATDTRTGKLPTLPRAYASRRTSCTAAATTITAV